MLSPKKPNQKIFSMKIKAFYSMKGTLALVAVALLFASCKKVLVTNEETNGLSTKRSVTNIKALLPGGNTRTVGYFSTHTTGNADWGKWIDSINVEQYSDVILAFINPDASGNFTLTPSITQAITKSHNAGVSRVFFGIASSSPTSDVSNQVNNNRANFISNIRKFLTNNNLEGVDLDFEGSGLISNFNPFVIQLADTLNLYSKKISVAIARWQANSISAAAYNRIDYLNVMSYDNGSQTSPGPHSSFSSFTTDFTTFKPKMGNNSSKINMGIPAYAWQYVNGTLNNQVGYGGIVGLYPTANAVNYYSPNPTTKWYYDGFPMIRQKIPYCQQQGIGGIMIWHVMADSRGNKSLIKFINYCLNNPNNQGFDPTSSYRFKNLNSGKYMDVAAASMSNGANVQQESYNSSSASQRWVPTNLGNGQFKFINANSGLALEAYGLSTANGVNIDQWSWGFGNNQKFTLVADGLGYYKVTNVNSGNVVETYGASTADGVNIDVWGWGDGPNQKWLIE
jgi:GH18 family chitinase